MRSLGRPGSVNEKRKFNYPISKLFSIPLPMGWWRDCSELHWQGQLRRFISFRSFYNLIILVMENGIYDYEYHFCLRFSSNKRAKNPNSF